MLVKCSNNAESIDSIVEKCVIRVCNDFHRFSDVPVVFLALNYVKCVSLIDSDEKNVLSDSVTENNNSNVVCLRQDNDEIKC